MAWLSLVPLLLVEGKLPGSEQVAVDPQDVLDAAHWLVLQDQLLDVAADDCNFCFATSTATEKDLSQIQSFNCQRVSKADKDYSHLAELYGQAVDASWKSRLAQAKALCDKAKLSMDPVRRANLAACAWGQVLMRERECCNVPGPPYCVSNSHSKAARVAVLLMAFVVAFGAVCLGKCGPCCEGFFVPSLALCSPPGPPKDEEDDAEEAKAAPHDAAHGSEATLKEKLTETWKGCEWAWTTRVDSGYPVGPLVQEESAAFQTELQLLEKVWVTHCQHFDFQEDSVLNQFEHFLSLWRSHCAALGDRRIPEVPQFGSKYGLMGHGLEEVYKELLYGYLAWEDQLQQRIGDHPLSGSDTNKRLKVIAMYLLVWGEAGNLRFMPEMIYLITWILLRSDPPAAAGKLRGDVASPTSPSNAPVENTFRGAPLGRWRQRCVPDGLDAASESGVASSLEPRGQSNKFLVEILRPIYHVVFNEHYDRVAIKYDEKDNNKPLDDKKLRKGYDTYLPADSANYDDWNELVMDVDRLLELELDDGLQPFGFLRSIRRDRLYGQLRDVPWKEVLCNAKVKTHRELHSWWGVFAATHRLWFLHLLLFLLCIFWASDKNYPHGKGWNVLLAGNDMTTCLSCVLMVVPLHIFAWKMSCWFTTGSALRRCRCTGEVLGPLFWSSTVFFSCLTFFWVRYVDAMDQDEAWSYGGVQLPFAAHVLVCCLGLFAILFQPGEHGKGNLSQVAASRPSTKLLRYIFWLSVMAVKVLASYNGVWAVETAMRELKKMSRPGRESLDDLPKFAFGPNWDKDMIQWLAIWGTSFVCFLADTQFWFVVGCTVLGFFLGCAERGWYLKSFVSEDALAKVAKRFSRRVALSEWNPDAVDRNQLLEKASIPLKSEVADQDYIPKERAENRTMSKFFPPVWDLIIDIMQCEDKLDPAAAAQLKFSVPLEDQDAPPPPAAPAAAAPDAAAPARQADAAVQTTAMQAAERVSCANAEPWRAMQQLCQRKLKKPEQVWIPSIFQRRNYGQLFIERHTGIIPTDSWPSNLEVQWRLNAFARNLGSSHLPRPYLTPHVPGMTVMIPHYGEQILMEPKDVYPDPNSQDAVPLIAWLEKRYHEDFVAFTNRMKSQFHDWPDYGTNWAAYQPKHWKHICLWASMRSQTFWRTVEGCMLYLPALERFHQMVEHIHQDKKMGWDATEAFSCLGCMQRYADFKDHEFAHAEQLLQRFDRRLRGQRQAKQSFKITYIEHKPRASGWREDAVHPRQLRRYYSCLIDANCERDPKDPRKRKPRFRVELPGFPILGDGKGDNQNSGIIYTRGSIIQAIDSNQGAYFEQMLLLPCALGEFRSTGGESLAARIVGFAEHITSDIGSLGDFAAGAETAFGTVLQRSYATLGARMHYGHPDMMNKEYMMQQGGVSKATKMLNLSEDIFAGKDFTLRGGPREIKHREYLHVGKGRDLGFNSVLFFFAKLSQGTGEQLLTRQMKRLGDELDLPEFLTFYYAHAGYYLTQFLLSKCIPLLVFTWLLLVLDDPEQNFPAIDEQQGGMSGATIMAKMLITQFAWLMPFFLLAQTAPLFLQMWWEKNILAAFLRIFKQ